jgi:NitT/TauT family transport system permease protein
MKRHLLTPVQLRLCVLAALLLAWEVVPRLGLVPMVILAPLSATLRVAIEEPGAYLAALATTLAEIAVGLVIAWGGGGVVGLVVGSVKPLRAGVLPVISSIYAIPFVVIYPIMTAWLGIGSESKVWFGGLYGFFPMALASAAGVQMVDTRLLVAALSMGATRLQLVREVMIPAALPALIAGLRLGGALVMIGVIVAEMLASTDGIGFLITQDRTMFRTPEVYFGIILVLIVAGSLDGAIGYVERRFSYSHGQRR